MILILVSLLSQMNHHEPNIESICNRMKSIYESIKPIISKKNNVTPPTEKTAIIIEFAVDILAGILTIGTFFSSEIISDFAKSLEDILVTDSFSRGIQFCPSSLNCRPLAAA